METADLYGIVFFLVVFIFGTIIIFLIFHGVRTRSMPKSELKRLTILIPFKNEKALLANLVKELNEKTKLNPLINVWLLNDHSSDLEAADLEELRVNDQIQFMAPIKGITGKKAVWNEVMNRVKTDWVLIMDADTKPPKSLFTPHLKIISKGAKCILIPIIPSRRKGAIASFFDLDFLSLHFAGLASANAIKPLLANAACMLIERNAYLESAKIRTDWSEPGGDDVFSMFAIAKTFGGASIVTLPASDSYAQVGFPARARDLWRQRQRWISKTGKIKNSWFQFIAWTVFITQMLFLTSLFSLLKTTPGIITLLGVSLLIIAELLYLVIASAKSKRMDLWPYILPAIFIYPFYLLALVIFGTFAKPKWK